MPGLNELYERHRDQGLVVIGVHTKRSREKLGAYMSENGFKIPVAVDAEEKTVKRYMVDGYPDYWLIDRSGKVRVADLSNGDVHRAVGLLLKEKAPVEAAKPVQTTRRAAPEAPLAVAQRYVKAAPERTYRMLKDGKQIGTYRQTNQLARQDGERFLRLADALEFRYGDTEVKISYETTLALDDRFSLVSMKGRSTPRNDEFQELEIAFGEKVSGTANGKRVSLETPKRLMTEFTLFRSALFMPLRAGATLEFDSLESTEMNMKRGHRLQCLGKEELRVGGRPYSAWKLEHTGKGISPAYYWFLDDWTLVRALIDGEKEWVLKVD